MRNEMLCEYQNAVSRDDGAWAELEDVANLYQSHGPKTLT